MDASQLGRISARDPTQRNRGNHRRSTQNSRMATASKNPRSHSHVQRTPSRDPSGQPSLATIPSWPPRKPSLHRCTLYILLSSSTLPTSSGSSSSVVSVCTSHSLHVPVGAVALLTPLATTAQHVLSQESYEPEEAPWKGQQHASAENGEPESPQTPDLQTATSRTCPGPTTVA